MKPLKNLIALILVTFITLTAFSQEDNSNKINSLNEGTIEQQFDYIARISSNYNAEGKRYEVINRIYFQSLKSNIIDSIKALDKEISDSKEIITSQEKTNSDLQKELDDTKSSLVTSNSEKDKISLFGMQLSKSFYNVLLWSIISVLLLLLFIFIFKFKSSNSITKAAKKSLEDIELEFEEHRRVALEREQKVRRQLQDEINKQKGNS